MGFQVSTQKSKRLTLVACARTERRPSSYAHASCQGVMRAPHPEGGERAILDRRVVPGNLPRNKDERSPSPAMEKEKT